MKNYDTHTSLKEFIFCENNDTTSRNALIVLLDVVFGSIFNHVLNITLVDLMDVAKYVVTCFVIGVGPGVYKSFVECVDMRVITVS